MRILAYHPGWGHWRRGPTACCTLNQLVPLVSRRIPSMLSSSSTRSCCLQEAEHTVSHETHVLRAREWVISSETLTVQTSEAPHFIDLTETVQDLIARLGIISG